ncbi:bola-like protein [Neoconidiobolus thromboides FSU 785]|nr:bola-like protein [Neoconidiobolus thromboides FSU 785]
MAADLITKQILEKALADKLSPSYVEVIDTSGGCGQSFEVIVVSEQFEGLPLLKRHRLVNECVKEEIAQLHAFSQKPYTPAQWKKIQDKKGIQ